MNAERATTVPAAGGAYVVVGTGTALLVVAMAGGMMLDRGARR